MTEEPNNSGVEVAAKVEHPYIIKDRERRRIGTEIDALIRGVGDRIYTEAARQHDIQGGAIDWSSWSTGGLKLQTPISLAGLKGEFPLLTHTLTQPVGEVQSRRDLIDDTSTITEIGYWNNPDGHYNALQITLKGGSADPNAERKIALEGGYFLGKSWGMDGWKGDSTRYADQSPEDYKALLDATKEADKLASKVLAGGGFKATLVSHTQRME